MKTRIRLLVIVALAFVGLGLLPKARAVVPPPDGGYPGGNTAEGQNALFSLTTGGYNTAVGFFSLRSDATGSFNTAMGAGTLLANIGDQNTATGVGAVKQHHWQPKQRHRSLRTILQHYRRQQHRHG
jgi:hypothetical protein